MSVKFLVDGTAVEVIEKTSTGFIVKKLYQARDEDFEEEEQEADVVYGDPQVVREVFDTPPTAQKHAEIASLEKHIKELTERRHKLSNEVYELSSDKWKLEREQKSYEKALAVVQGRNVALARLGDFLDGKITHYVHVDYYRVQIVKLEETKEDYSWNERQFRLLTLHGHTGGDLSWKLGHYSSRDGGDYTVYPCVSLEEAQAVAKEKLIEMCNRDRLDEGGIGRIIECSKSIGFEVPQELVLKRDKLIMERLERGKKNAIDALEKAELEIAKFRKERAKQ